MDHIIAALIAEVTGGPFLQLMAFESRIVMDRSVHIKARRFAQKLQDYSV